MWSSSSGLDRADEIASDTSCVCPSSFSCLQTLTYLLTDHHPYINTEGKEKALTSRTLLKLNAYYAFPALSNGEPQEPYTSTCLHATRSIVQLTAKAREIGWIGSSSPLFIWSSWVAARVLFGMSFPSFLSLSVITTGPDERRLISVYSFLSHRSQPDDDFDIIVSALKEQSQYWTLASKSRCSSPPCLKNHTITLPHPSLSHPHHSHFHLLGSSSQHTTCLRPGTPQPPIVALS